MTKENLIDTLYYRLDKLKKENLEFYNLIQNLKGKLVKAESQIKEYQTNIKKYVGNYYE